MRIEVNDLSFSYGSHDVLRGVSFSAHEGQTIALLGPNGAGKSTLFRCMLGFLRPSAGDVRLDEKPLGAYPQKELARKIAYIPQSYSPAFDYTVLECVLMGLTAHLGTFDAPSKADEQAALAALESLGIAELASRSCGRISGGERQLMLLARALVQKARLLLMDEPTASLDYGNSCRVMQRIKALAQEGYTVIFSTHDPNQALRYASRVLALKDGALTADGAPEAVMTTALLRSLYGVRVNVARAQIDGKTQLVLLPATEEGSDVSLDG